MWALLPFASSPEHCLPRIQFLFIGSRLCSTLLSDLTSRLGPCASLSLHLHLVVKRTCTSQLSIMLGTPTKRAVRQWRTALRSLNFALDDNQDRSARICPPRQPKPSGMGNLSLANAQTRESRASHWRTSPAHQSGIDLSDLERRGSSRRFSYGYLVTI